ncbi:MAG: large subunit ribosomal protein L17 [Lysobacterales bacterium]|jgi:large subunit ribosomal protein L17
MRHKISGNTLNRMSSHRKATVRDIAKATLIHERIQTTKVKAKESRKMVDKLITLGKKGELSHKRRAFAILCDHKLVSNLFNETAPLFKSRNGGYTRIIPIGKRRGDNAEVVILELTEKKIVATPKVEETVEPKKEVKKVSKKEVKVKAESKEKSKTETKASKKSTKAPKKDK